MALSIPSRRGVAARTAATPLPPIHPLLLRLFRLVVRVYFWRHFRSVMGQGLEHLRGHRGPLVIFGNHSSWWDPMLLVLLASKLLPNARHYAPIDAAALLRYPILARIGLFPVELATARGAVQFLRTAEAILASGGVLWVTPQGRFVDSRVRPLQFRPGLGALAARLPHVPLLPLASEYTFWDERLPEALCRFGDPVRVAPGKSVAEITLRLEQVLDEEMNTLKGASCARDAEAFSNLLTGTRGAGGPYGLMRRLLTWASGRHFQTDHTPR